MTNIQTATGWGTQKTDKKLYGMETTNSVRCSAEYSANVFRTHVARVSSSGKGVIYLGSFRIEVNRSGKSKRAGTRKVVRRQMRSNRGDLHARVYVYIPRPRRSPAAPFPTINNKHNPRDTPREMTNDIGTVPVGRRETVVVGVITRAVYLPRFNNPAPS